MPRLPLSLPQKALARLTIPKGSRVVTDATPMEVRKPRKAKREPFKPWCEIHLDGEVALGLPEPPSANRYWRVYRNRVVRSKEATAYIAAVALIARHLAPFSGDVSVRINWHRTRKSGDLDNRLKVVLDALRGCAYHDDSQVVEIHATRYDDWTDSGVVVLVKSVP